MSSRTVFFGQMLLAGLVALGLVALGRAADSNVPSPPPAQRDSGSEGTVRGGKFLSAARLGAENAVGQLPSEATLPGQTARPRELPDEALLPTAMLPPNHLVSQIRVLPAEHELPEAVLPEPPQLLAPPQPQLAEIRKPKGRPWLRLNMPGHTGTIRALAFTTDSQRLCSAGEDKDVHVWLKSQDRELSRREWIHERTVRWQVQRGARGQIRCLAAAPDLLAVAGHGAMGRNGEILLIDPATGALRRYLIDEQSGHQQESRQPGSDGSPQSHAMKSR